MNLPANFPLKKVIITVVSVVIVIALIITGVTVAVNGKAANATVDVEQVSNISTQYWCCAIATFPSEDCFNSIKLAMMLFSLQSTDHFLYQVINVEELHFYVRIIYYDW